MDSLIFKTIFGSAIYGTQVPSSDTDYKGIALPEPKDIILQRSFKTQNTSTKENESQKNTENDVDLEIFSLHYFLNLFLQGQTVCYDMLFSPRDKWIVSSPIWEELVLNKDKIVSSKIDSFAGYCQAQAAKYSLKGSNLASFRMAVNFFINKPPRTKLIDIRNQIVDGLINVSVLDKNYNGKDEPVIKFVYILNKSNNKMEEYIQIGPKTKVPMLANCQLAFEIFQTQFEKYGERAKLAETNQGVDWKALMHAVRVCGQAIELLNTGNIVFPRPDKDLLLKIRKGELSYKEVSELIVKGLDELSIAKERTQLRETADTKWVEDFIFDKYKQRISNG